jgi:hypothetical protein
MKFQPSKIDDSSIKENFLDYHDQILERRNHEYNHILHLLRVPFSPRYSHPILKFFFKYYKVHSTRDSLHYAISLLKTEDPTMELRAQKILYRLLSLQITNNTSPCYGIWPKYWEEMISGIFRPDLNWADFLGSYLLLVVLQFHQKLPSDLLTQIDRAIIHAARAIQQRNIDLNYTNIAVRGIYVTLVAAETYGIDDLYEYGLMRLHQIHHQTMHQGSFTEYNSPVYGIDTLESLGRLRLHVKNDQAKIWVEDLYRLAWENIAYYFHPPTQQWAGPHSRSYSTQIQPYVISLIEQSTTDRVKFDLPDIVMVESQLEIPLPCPVDLEPYFLQISEPRTQIQTIANAVPQKRLTTYMTPDFALGSVSYSDLWHQRRSLIAYWGTRKKSRYLRLRFLCDEDDFATAQFVSVQKEGNVLAGLMFATDIDRLNPYVECQTNQVLTLNDLRLRFEVTGLITGLKQSTNTSKSLTFCVDDIWIQLSMAYAQFGDMIGKWEVTQKSSKTYLDWVFLSGRQHKFNLATMRFAAMGMGISLSSHYESIPPIEKLHIGKILALRWCDLSLSFQACPGTQSVLFQTIGNESILIS